MNRSDHTESYPAFTVTPVHRKMADEAARRREARRRKILTNSEDRMKRLMGYQKETNDEQSGITAKENTSSPASSLTHTYENDNDQDTQTFSNHHTSYVTNVHKRRNLRNQEESTLSEQKDFVNKDSEHVNKDFMHSEEESVQTQVLVKHRTVEEAFSVVRLILSLVVGGLVRLALLSSFGTYVQNIFNPFVALEIVFIGFQRSTRMDYGAGVTGGLWLSTLVLSGVNQDIIDTYKNIMGMLTSVADDFTVYFFAFIAVHLCV